MSKVTIKYNQSVVDLGVQVFGSVEAIMELAFENDISLTEELTEGEELIIPGYKTDTTEIMNFYNKHQIKPVTALTSEDFSIIEIENCNLCNCFK